MIRRNGLLTCFHFSSRQAQITYRLCLYRLKLSSKGVPQLVEVFDEEVSDSAFSSRCEKCIFGAIYT